MGQLSSLTDIVSAVTRDWPQHATFVQRSLGSYSADDKKHIEAVAHHVVRVLDSNLERAATDYRWVCSKMMEAEMYYRRHGRPANRGFDEVLSGIYSTAKEDMGRYMRGLLLSQVLWRQHIGPLLSFRNLFVPRLAPSSDYLEVGPGHGLWMGVVSQADPSIRLHGWDISQESLSQTAHALVRARPHASVSLAIKNICETPSVEAEFGAAVASQVLEIVSSPEGALRTLATVLRRSGLLFLNIPVRAAAPDHVRRWRDAEEPTELVRQAGFEIMERLAFGSRAGPIGDGDGFSLVLIAKKA